MCAGPDVTVLPERWFRVTPDSALLDRPRLLARSLIDAADLDTRIRVYERLTGTASDLRMPIPDFGGLELSAVGTMLLIGSVRPFTPIQRRTDYSVIVPSLSRQLDRLRTLGADVLEPPETILPGSRARVRHPDGTVAELVEHRPRPGEEPRPPAPWHTRRPEVRLLVRRAVPAGDFASRVLLYEALLDTVCESRVRLDGGPHPVELAVVGNLLLVGTDGPLYAEHAAVRLALVTPRPHDLPGARPLPGPERPAGAPDRPSLVRLEDGLTAEVWDAAIGLFPTPARSADLSNPAPPVTPPLKRRTDAP